MIGNIFLQSWLIWAIFHTTGEHFFHQKFPLLSSDLKNVLTKDFPMQPFANVLQIRCSRESQEISVLEPLFNPCFNKVTGLMTCNFIKKETPTQVFSCEYLKMFEKNFLWNTSGGCFWEWFWRISKNSKSGLTRNNLYDLTNLNV